MPFSAVEGAEGTSSRAGSEASDSLSHDEPLSRASSVEQPQAHHGAQRLPQWHHLRPPGGGLQEDRLSDGLSQRQSTGSSDGGLSGECSTNPLHSGLLLERIRTASKVRAGTMHSCRLCGRGRLCLGVAKHQPYLDDWLPSLVGRENLEVQAGKMVFVFPTAYWKARRAG